MAVALKHLFQPGRIGTLEIDNRLVMPPLVTWSAPDASITDAHVAFYRERAEGGVGLVIVQATGVHPDGRPKDWLGLWDDRFIPGLARVARTIRNAGARAGIQLHHGGLLAPRPIGPSDGVGFWPGTSVRGLPVDEMAMLRDAFVRAAVRAREAGFEMIEVHGAHGYLLCSFLSPVTNHRDDEYGGSVENRARYPREVVAAMRAALGADFPIGFRINGADFVPGGTTPEEAARQAALIAAAGADVIHVTAGTPSSVRISYLHPQGALTHLAANIRKAVAVPVIAVGKISDPPFADEVIARGDADFVALGRALMADPQWPRKAREGRFDEIRRCIYCLMCLPQGGRDLARYPSVSCSVNPSIDATWRGEDYDRPLPAARPRRILVAGGGLAGMHAATILARRGHRVTVYEAGEELGGQWVIAARQDYKKDSNFPELLDLTVRDLKASGAEVHVGRPLTREVVERERPDVVVLATGARTLVPDIPGIDSSRGTPVVHANDVLTGHAATGRRAVVIGAGYVGMEVALHLAERGTRVFLLTRSKVGNHVGAGIRRILIDRLVEAGVQLFPNSPVVEVVKGGVKYAADGEYWHLNADTVVLAAGARSEGALAGALGDAGVEVHRIGDVVEPRDAFSALHEAASLGHRL